MPCKGVCVRYRASNHYTNGHKRCQICELFIKWDGLCCPCCGYRLRTRPRNPKLNAKLREQERAIKESKKMKILYHMQNI
jgi:hypothetical protein